jgi:NADPH:quinone reductase-like Zn-dependent oxidoreductase
VKAIYAMPTTEVLNDLADAVASGRLTIPIQRTYTLDQVPAALSDFEQGALGKLAIAVR